MSVVSIFSPNKLTVSGVGGSNFQTEYVSNPWGSGPVWIQCTTKYVGNGDYGQADFGILELDYLDDEGRFQRLTFADASNPGAIPMGSLLARAFASQLLGVTVAANVFNAFIEGTLTLFQWG